MVTEQLALGVGQSGHGLISTCIYRWMDGLTGVQVLAYPSSGYIYSIIEKPTQFAAA